MFLMPATHRRRVALAIVFEKLTLYRSPGGVWGVGARAAAGLVLKSTAAAMPQGCMLSRNIIARDPTLVGVGVPVPRTWRGWDRADFPAVVRGHVGSRSCCGSRRHRFDREGRWCFPAPGLAAVIVKCRLARPRCAYAVTVIWVCAGMSKGSASKALSMCDRRRARQWMPREVAQRLTGRA